MSALGQAAAGFIDNKRTGLLHKDNLFEYESYVGGVAISSKDVEVEGSSSALAYTFGEVWAGINNEQAIGFVEANFPAMLAAFKPVIELKTYDK